MEDRLNMEVWMQPPTREIVKYVIAGNRKDCIALTLVHSFPKQTLQVSAGNGLQGQDSTLTWCC